LTPDLKTAFLKDTINPSVALLLARIPEALQSKASKTVLEGKYGQGPLPYRQAVEFLKENYTLTLSGAPFDTKDEALCGGSCAKCPKRTGNEPELFADIKSADVCTDPDCFKEKAESSWTAKAEKFKKAGYTVLPFSKSRSLFGCGDYLQRCDHYELKSVCGHDKKKRTYRELLPNLKNEDVLIAQDGSGKVRQLVKVSVADAMMREEGYKFMEKVNSREPEKKQTPEEQAAEERKKAAQEVAFQSAVDQIVAKVEAGHKSLSILQDAAREVFDASMRQDEIASRRKLKTTSGVEKAISAMKAEQCLGLIVECFMGKVCFNWNGMDETNFKKAVKDFGLDGVLLLKQALNASEEKSKK